MYNISHDSTPEIDFLERKKFAEQITTSLTNYFIVEKESIVVGISGAWGSGKSTLLGFVEQELNSRYTTSPELKIIKFNPWTAAFTDTEDLQRALLETVIKELETIPLKNTLENANLIFKSYLNKLNYLKWIKHVHPIANNIIEAVEDYTSKEKISTLEDVHKQADKLLREQNIHLYIFIDDLDRLTNEEIVVVFKMIKFNLSFKNTCYIIAYDKQVVARALQKEFENGQAYLEKIIQVDFTMPEIHEEQLENLFFSELKKIGIELEIQFNENEVFTIWNTNGFKAYYKNIRDIKRYFNSLALSLPHIKDEVNLNDFLVLEGIKVFDHSAYTSLYHQFQYIQRKALIGEASFDEQFFKEFKNQISADLIRHLLRQKSEPGLNDYSINEKRLKDPDNFIKYFTLHLGSHDTSEQTIKNFFQHSGRTAILRQVVENNKLLNFLRRLSDKELSTHYKLKDLSILDAFIKYFDLNESIISDEIEQKIWNAYFNMAHSFNNKFAAAKHAVELLDMSENTFQPMKLVFNYFIFDNIHNKKNDPLIYGDINKQLEIQGKKLFKSFNSYLGKMFPNYFWQATNSKNQYIARLAILSYATYDPAEYEKNLKISEFMEDPNLGLFFIKQFFVRINKEGIPYTIDLSLKDRLLPAEVWRKFKEILEMAKEGTWNENDQVIVEYFLAEIQSQYTS